MCRRAQEPACGQWFLPSGFLELGETLEEGAARETFEETGIVIDPAEFELASVISLPSIGQISVVFRIALQSEPPTQCGPECLEVAFLAEEEILMTDKLAWHDSLGTAPRVLYGELRSGHFSIKLITIGDNQGKGFKSRHYGLAGVTDHKP